MSAPTTVLPQISSPSQNRQIGAVRNAGCQFFPNSLREDEIALCSHGSHAARNSRGALTAMKSRLAGSLPKRLQCMAPHNAAGHLNSRNAGSKSGL